LTRLLDVGVVVVLVGFASTFLVLRHEQHRDDGAAARIAAWAQEQGVTRIAWPEDRRGAVPALRSDGITPVLYEPSGSATQDAAVNDTAIRVTERPSDLDGLDLEPLGAIHAGELTATRLDLEAAASTPIELHRGVGQEISRPYVYSPIAPSARFTPEEPFTVDLVLGAGRYVVEAAVFDGVELGDSDRIPKRVRLTVSRGEQVMLAYEARLTAIVEQPVTRTMRIPPFLGGRMRLQIELVTKPTDGGRNIGHLHAWSVVRTS
jgi:hypothetical protein